MSNTFLFSIAAVFCVALFTTAAEKRKNDVTISQPAVVDISLKQTAENEELYINASGLVNSKEYECKCNNGTCVRACDVEKTVPCLDKRKVCVCNPEFVQRIPNECEYCDCGPGFGCEFKLDTYGTNTKTCICPEGYWKWDFGGKCRPECNSERRCQNGGSCYGNKCRCMPGTSGDLCEVIDECRTNCRNRVEVDCLYDRRKSSYHCRCKNASLYYDYDTDICRPCPCGNGYCDHDDLRQLKCRCSPGYQEFSGYCRRCDCGDNFGGRQCQYDSSGGKLCTCDIGFFAREGRCRACACSTSTGDTIQCELVDNVKRCLCEEGFQNVLGKCEDIDECETNNTCHPSAECRNTYGSFECECPKGYKGINGRKTYPGVACEDIDECQSYPCMFKIHAKCTNLPGSFKCECLRGYQPRTYYTNPDDTACIEAKQSWTPTVIVIFISGALILVAALIHIRLKTRTSLSS